MGWFLIIIRDNRAQCFKTQIPWTIKWLRRVRQYKAGKRTRAKERSGNILWPFSLLAGWVYGLWFLCPGTSEGSTGSGSGFKLSQKTGPRLKVSSGRLGEAGNRTYNPGLRDIHLFVAFLGINQFRRVGLTYVLVLRREHLEMKVTTLASYRSAILIWDPLTYRHHF